MTESQIYNGLITTSEKQTKKKWRDNQTKKTHFMNNQSKMTYFMVVIWTKGDHDVIKT